MYLPVLGLSLVVIDMLRRFAGVLAAGRACFGSALAICAVLAVTSMRQVMYWNDSVTLFARAVELQPRFWFAQLGSGTALASVKVIAVTASVFREARQQIMEAGFDDMLGKPLRAEERALPLPGRGEVRIKVEACAVCRTDLHVVDGDLPNPQLPVIPGHEIVGVVEDTRMYGLANPSRLEVYRPLTQTAPDEMDLIVKSRVEPTALTSSGCRTLPQLSSGLHRL